MVVDHKDIQRKCKNKDPKKRREAIEQLINNFESLSDRKQAWEDLHRLTSDEDSGVRLKALEAMGTVFQHVPDKKHAWEDLHELTLNKDFSVRWSAVLILGNDFQYIPDKKQAWEDLSKLTSDKNEYVRLNAQWVLATAFKYIPEKNQAWFNLYWMKVDKNHYVRQGVAQTLGTAIQYTLDKNQAWIDLRSLIYDEDEVVRVGAAQELGTAFKYAPDIKQVLEDLHNLILDEDSCVRANAYHSLGRFSIYEASQSRSEEAYIEKLKNSIVFFEKASNEDSWCPPSNFCLPLYRSFYAIINNEKQQARDEVQKYLAEAKEAVGGSKNKKLLIEAIENLAKALEEVQNMWSIGLEAKKEELNFYRKYCEQASELMNETQEAAPYATIVMRKGLPIFDRKLKSLLEEIQEKARIACQESKGTDSEEIACAVSREIQKWEIGSQEEMTWYVENLIFTLESSVPKAPENKSIFDKIEQIREENILVRQYAILCSIIPMIPNLHVNKTLYEIKNEAHEINEKIDRISISLKPGFSEELVITVGGPIPHFSVDHVVTISLQVSIQLHLFLTSFSYKLNT